MEPERDRDATPEPPLLVTGATGFVGRHLFEAFRETNDPRPLLGLVRDASSWTDYDWTRDLTNVSLVEGSLADPGAWAETLPPLAGIFHCAALVRHSRLHPEEVFETNVEGTLAMVRLAAAHHCRLIVLSTTGTVGCFDSPDPMADEDAPYVESTVAGWPYYRSKIEMEKRARALAVELGVELVLVRPPMLLGPGDHRLRATSNVLRMLRGRLPFLVQGGMHFADVRDATHALRRAMHRPEARSVYHLDGTCCGIQEFFGMIEQVSGVPAPRRVLPYPVARFVAGALERIGIWLRGEPLHLVPDPVVIEMAAHYWGARSLHAANDLAYKCRDPKETLRDTADWLLANA